MLHDQIFNSEATHSCSIRRRILATVSGRTTCAPYKVEGLSVALVLTSTCTPVVGYSMALRGCQRVDIDLHACGQLQLLHTVWLGKSRLILTAPPLSVTADR